VEAGVRADERRTEVAHERIERSIEEALSVEPAFLREPLQRVRPVVRPSAHAAGLAGLEDGRPAELSPAVDLEDPPDLVFEELLVGEQAAIDAVDRADIALADM